MKKILLMLALMLPCLGVWAQEIPTNCEVTFTNIQKDGTTKFTLYIDESGQLALSNESVETLGDAAIFFVEKRPGNKYSFYNRKKQLYMIWRGKGNGYNNDKGVLADYNSTYCDWSFSDGEVINETQTYFFASKRNGGTSDGTLVVMKATGAFDAYGNSKGWHDNYSNLYAIEKVSNNSVDVTYKYMLEGNEVYSQVATQTVNNPFYAPIILDASYATFTQPAGNVTSETTEVEVTCKQNLPFHVSNNYNDATWYFMTIRNDGKYISYSETAPYSNNTTYNHNDEHLWAFIGDAFGVKIINKAAGEGKYLSYDNTNTGSNVYMKDTETSWILQKGNGGFLLRQAGANEYVHDYSSKLQFWNNAKAATDNGSAFKVYLPEFMKLQEAYDAAMANQVGEAVGMYKETDGFVSAKTYVETILQDIRIDGSDSDSEQLKIILDWFIGAYEDAIVKMAPGYYYVKGTGTGNNSDWYLTHKINNGKESLWAAIPNALNADYIWKFETCEEDGYKMQCVNVGKYFQLKTATNGGDNYTYITEDFTQGNKMLLTDNGVGKFSIKNANNQNIRTEDGDATGAQVNYWSGETNETWYLIPATELEVTISAVGYSTIHLPFDVVLPEGLDAYSVVTEKVTAPNGEKSGWVTLDDSKKSIPANTGAILASESALADGEAKEYKLQIAEANDSWTGNLLRGTNVNTYVEEDAYVLSNQDGIGLYKAKLNKNANGEAGETHFLNNANKAYLPNTFGASLVLHFNFGGETTAIESVLNNSADANAPIYDLSGRRVMNTVKGGIYIQNGKKFVVK